MFFLHIGISSLPGRSFLVLSAPGHAESQPEHHGASVGPGWGSWHTLWAFKVSKLASNHGEAFRAHIISHPGPCKSTYRLTKCLTGCAYRSEFCERLALIASAAYYNYACVDHCYACSVMIYACIRFVCALFSYSTTVQQQSHSKFAWNRCIGISYMLYV